MWIGFVAYRGEENEEAYRDEGSGQKEQSHNSDDLHGNRLRLRLTSDVFHLMRHVLHFCR